MNLARAFAIPMWVCHAMEGDRILVGGQHPATVLRSVHHEGIPPTWMLVVAWEDALEPPNEDGAQVEALFLDPHATVRRRWWRG